MIISVSDMFFFSFSLSVCLQKRVKVQAWKGKRGFLSFFFYKEIKRGCQNNLKTSQDDFMK